uniref:Uncharacterized protein n=1 Tax=Salmonella sp. TaxID=599 RepID=A0A482EX80_SALSP|nr:hypothetical protein NNIBIDOC_00126 [Salmonella sp.]
MPDGYISYHTAGGETRLTKCRNAVIPVSTDTHEF